MISGSLPGLVLYVAVAACLLASLQAGTLPRHHISQKRLKHARVKAIKEDLLRKLQLTSIPRMNARPTNASRMEEERRVLQMYQESLAELEEAPAHSLFDSNDYLAKEFHSFTDTGSYPEGVDPNVWNSQLNSHICLYIPLNIPQPATPIREKVTHSATLKIMTVVQHPELVQPVKPSGSVDHLYRVNLYQLLEPATSSQGPLKRLVDSVLVSLDTRTSWLTFNVKSAVDAWLRDSSSNHGLELRGEDDLLFDTLQVMTHRTIMEGVGDENAISGRNTASGRRVLPSLHVHTQTRTILDLGRHRTSRALTGENADEDCRQGDGERRCCRFPLSISFSMLGWSDWIIEPSGFKAYFCDGTCPYRHKSAHLFTDVQSFVNLVNPKAAPAPCCTATKLRPLSLVHYDEDGILVISTVEDMIIEQCMCA